MDLNNSTISSRNDLNRSFSAPCVPSKFQQQNCLNTRNPYVRSVYVEEVFHGPNAPPILRRQFSCQEICTPRSTNCGISLHPLSSQAQTDLFDVKKVQIGIFSDQVESNMAFSEPMDIDTSLNNSREDSMASRFESGEPKITVKEAIKNNVFDKDQKHPDVDLAESESDLENDSDLEGPVEIQSCLSQIKVKKRPNIPRYIKFILFAVTIAALAVLLHFALFDLNANLDIQKLERDLHDQVHWQKDPIHAVINNLKYNNWSKNIKVIGFVGRTGVGKTFITNILKQNFYHKLVHDFHGSMLRDETKQNKLINTLHRDYVNLIIIDDLTANDTDVFIKFIKKTEDNDILALVMSIFSIQAVDKNLQHVVNYHDIGRIQKAFSKSDVDHEVVVFDELDESHANEWLVKQLSSRTKKGNLQKIADRVLQEHDVLKHGLKGLHSKLSRHLDETEVEHV